MQTNGGKQNNRTRMEFTSKRDVIEEEHGQADIGIASRCNKAQQIHANGEQDYQDT